MSIILNSMAEAKGKFLCDGAIEILDEPRFDKATEKWTALANAYGTLAIIELRVTPLPVSQVQGNG